MPGMVAQVCVPSPVETEKGQLNIQGQYRKHPTTMEIESKKIIN